MVLDNEERQLWDAYRETGDASELLEYYRLDALDTRSAGMC